MQFSVSVAAIVFVVDFNDVSEGHPTEHRNLTVLTGLRSVVEVMSQFHMKSVLFASGNQILNFIYLIFNIFICDTANTCVQ